jgi:hypothetical protein
MEGSIRLIRNLLGFANPRQFLLVLDSGVFESMVLNLCDQLIQSKESAIRDDFGICDCVSSRLGTSQFT